MFHLSISIVVAIQKLLVVIVFWRFCHGHFVCDTEDQKQSGLMGRIHGNNNIQSPGNSGHQHVKAEHLSGWKNMVRRDALTSRCSCHLQKADIGPSDNYSDVSGTRFQTQRLKCQEWATRQNTGTEAKDSGQHRGPSI